MDISVAHYRLLDRLGEGGLGEVFRARDTKVGRTVALKLLPRGFLDKPAPAWQKPRLPSPVNAHVRSEQARERDP